MSLRKYPRDSLLLRRLFKEAVSTHALYIPYFRYEEE
jgi:hypothetical protein